MLVVEATQSLVFCYSSWSKEDRFSAFNAFGGTCSFNLLHRSLFLVWHYRVTRKITLFLCLVSVCLYCALNSLDARDICSVRFPSPSCDAEPCECRRNEWMSVWMNEWSAWERTLLRLVTKQMEPESKLLKHLEKDKARFVTWLKKSLSPLLRR